MTATPDKIEIASNLGFGIDERLRKLPFLSNLFSLPVSGPWEVPASAQVLVYLHRHNTGGRDAPRPAGWPGNLKAVLCAAAGLDHYPDWLFEAGPVACARGTNSASIAEYTLAAMLSHEKRIPSIWQDGQKHWPDLAQVASAPLGSLRGRTLGLVGWGSIAQHTAALAQPFGMKIVACRRSAGPAVEGVTMLSFDEVIAAADHLLLALPLTKESRGMMSASNIAAMKNGAHLINVSRGALIDQSALEAALFAGKLGAATLDVTDPEPLPIGSSLYSAPGIRISAHVSWASAETMANIGQKLGENLHRFACGQALNDVVDAELRY